MRNDLLRFLVGGTMMLVAMLCWTMVYPIVWGISELFFYAPLPSPSWKRDMAAIANYFFPAQ